jgi:hypothetical protein
MIENAHEGHALALHGAHTHALTRGVAQKSTRQRERVALCTCLSASLFLASYLVLHALHLAARDPSYVTRISQIPLFANIGASAMFGLFAGVAWTSLVRRPERFLRHLPLSLAVLTIVFVLEAVLFP